MFFVILATFSKLLLVLKNKFAEKIVFIYRFGCSTRVGFGFFTRCRCFNTIKQNIAVCKDSIVTDFLIRSVLVFKKLITQENFTSQCLFIVLGVPQVVVGGLYYLSNKKVNFFLPFTAIITQESVYHFPLTKF